eukprot:TRINITY_DN46873_c0_g1_i1.p1 TRINITY_DN46873_c0_g1~~TRINITY_DN46873_c0_g1_i1.p1  ORF type:complete len:433 (+),score=146.88 TRINITY_DN46873_c0_g1_i1:116-1414(+)
MEEGLLQRRNSSALIEKRGAAVAALDEREATQEDSHPSYRVTESGSFAFRGIKLTSKAVETDHGSVEQLVDFSTLDMDSARPLGTGSSGQVYEVTHKPTGSLVAVKRIPIADKRRRDEIQKELLMLQQNIPYVIRVYGAVYDPKGYVLIPMERMDGSLADAIKLHGGDAADSIAERTLQGVAKQALLGLSYLHGERRVMHRDIKPANILLNRQGALKISDFGVAKAVASRVDCHAGETSTFVGTQFYMSPERLRGEHTSSFAGDVWSMGLCLVQCAVRSNPWQPLGISERSSFFDLLALVEAGKVPRVPDTYSDRCVDCVDLCLRSDPAERPSAAELLQHPWLCGMSEEESVQEVRGWVLALCRRAAAPTDRHQSPDRSPMPFSPQESPALDPSAVPPGDVSPGAGLPGFHPRPLEADELDKCCAGIDAMIG